MPSASDPAEARRRKLHAWAAEFELTRDDRIALAQQLLRRDVTSWKDLDDDQVSRLLDAFEGCHLILELIHQRS